MKRIPKLMTGILLVSILLTGIESSGDDIIGDTNSAGNGWSESNWFGWVYDSYSPFYMHAQHGWIYAQKWNGWVWMWDYSVHEWFATSERAYPMVYDFLSDNWLWYYEGTSGPRWYVDMEDADLYSEYHGALIPFDVIEMVDKGMGLMGAEDPNGGDEEPNLMSEAMGYVLIALIGDPATMVCPSISRTPEAIDITALPPTVEASLDFGSGCIPEDGESTMSGSLSIRATNLSFTDAGIYCDLLIEANALSRDGLLVMDGAITGSIDVGMGLDGTTFDVTLELVDVSSVDSTVSGQARIVGSVITSDDPDVGVTDATVDVTVSDLVVDGGLPNSGTLHLVMDESLITVDVSLQTILGPGTLSLIVSEDANEGMLINTKQKASLMDYSVEVNDVLIDSTICETMPVSGSVVFEKSGADYRVQFTGDCEEGFRISKK